MLSSHHVANKNIIHEDNFKRTVIVSKINLNELNTIGECLLEEAGKVIVKIRHEIHNKDYKLKNDDSIVTEADMESHKIIMHSLQLKYKGLKIRSEEDGNLKSSDIAEAANLLSKCDNHIPAITDPIFEVKDLTVWIDPLDATQEYSENLTDYVTVMFCVAIKGEPRVGIIHKPFTQYTVKTFLENEPERIGKPKLNNRIIISRSHGEWFSEFSKTLATNYTTIQAGGSGFKTISLLEDKADVYVHNSKIKKWDICAPHAVLKNKGGDLKCRDGKRIDYSDRENTSIVGFIAALENFSYYYDSFKIRE